MSYTKEFLQEAINIIEQLDSNLIDRMVDGLVDVRERGGRLFFLGVGGSAGHASHAVNDFRKIANIESYAPTDNVSELTARINDDGWESCFERWLKGSRLNSKDALFIFSVGGGNEEKNVSVNIVNSIKLAKSVDADIFGVVGRDGGFTAKNSQYCLIIPSFNKDTVTPQTEAFAAVIWHLIVSHPKLQANAMKWESI